MKRFLRNLHAKQTLKYAFNAAGLYAAKRLSNGNEARRYPKIHDVDINEERMRYVFTLLNGMDPKEIAKKEFVFRQVFGRNVELSGDLKRYVLTVYSAEMPAVLRYDFVEIQPVIERHKLGIIAGKDRHGRYVSFDLLTQPHILIAGETGSGKSTQLRSILTTLIKQNRPDRMQLYLADCKKSEFHVFRKVEHVQCVLTSAEDIRRMLRSIKRELDERSNLTEQFEISHIDELPDAQRRPYIVVCIDEFLLLRKDAEIMDVLAELVAIGRTLGVFAILSMQRPNAKTLDTTIRANLTVSMGFKLRDITEARIVNTPGAEKLDVSGRFIMAADKTYELQAPYLEMNEAKALLNPYCVMKSPTKDVTPPAAEPEILTEKDVFIDGPY
ncbi:FtsK/SpoIIIE domain-containing protein [Bacillus subtilis]|uniref:FtsK/SpoIIIE domain-containing protein n=1 Tax=Bacillus subtilis TaxID=1423 RepID=UPI00129DF03B|nr:FtsK/SpoIIIE domain-containing protein [Bacillus subtilis]QGI00244.1 AAA family ATPase [Bacillus subtilis]